MIKMVEDKKDRMKLLMVLKASQTHAKEDTKDGCNIIRWL